MTPRPETAHHAPVFATRAATLVSPCPGQIILETNLGDGGHTAEFLTREPTIRILAFELDPDAIARAAHYLGPERFRQVTVFQTSFANLESSLAPLGLMGTIDGALVDPGLSLKQATVGEYGFSFMADGPLKMTFDPEAHPNAADVLATLDAGELASLFGAADVPSKQAHLVAEAVVSTRHRAPLETTTEFRELIVRTLGHAKEGKRHVATRYFMALRMAVNHELADLDVMLPQLLKSLKVGGVGVLLSYHGGESKLMREFLKTYKHAPKSPRTDDLRLEVIAGPESPSREEIRRNPAARSALLRAFRRGA